MSSLYKAMVSGQTQSACLLAETLVESFSLPTWVGVLFLVKVVPTWGSSILSTQPPGFSDQQSPGITRLSPLEVSSKWQLRDRSQGSRCGEFPAHAAPGKPCSVSFAEKGKMLTIPARGLLLWRLGGSGGLGIKGGA